ncbi:hypothetical protein ACLB2K_043916 [Fragaria x ananassa]
MNVLCWNCQGIGNPWTVDALKGLVTLNLPKLVFLSETRCTATEMNEVRRKIGWKNAFSVNCRVIRQKGGKRVGRGGGLCIMWNDDIKLELRSFSESHIDVTVKEEDGKRVWRFTGVYGRPKSEERHLTWDLLKKLDGQDNGPWLLGGDFNEIMSSIEKEGGQIRAERQMDGFREVLNVCNLKDLYYTGPCFTWRGNRHGAEVKERLDRFLGSSTWLQLFPTSKVTHLPPNESDHLPILIQIQRCGRRKKRKKRRKFRFEEFWLREKDVKEIIEVELEKELKELMHKEQTFWQQRSRVLWLAEGDLNTRYFHQKATNRKKKNTLKGLFNEDGVWCNDESEMEEIITRYYKSLFTTSRPQMFDDDLRFVSSVVSEDMSRSMNRDISEEEVVKALKQMHPSKAPGPDGFSPVFYQQF